MSTRLNSTAHRDIESLIHPYTNLARHPEVGPLMLTRAKGIYVYDERGKEYIEGMSGLWCAALGYGEEELVEAAASQMRTLSYTHLFAHKSHEPALRLAEKIKEISPIPVSKVLFSCSGSEANDTLIKLIWYANNARGRPNKKKIVSRRKAYHGATIATASLTGLPALHTDFDLPYGDRFLHADCPHFYREGRPGETEEEFATRLAASLEALIDREGAETIAAFIAEPIMGGGGVIVPPAGYFEKVNAVLARHDIPMISDEVICGFGRTGNMFGCETFRMKPDFLTLAKGLSSGYLPISAITLPEETYQAMVEESRKLGSFGHGYTYGGHPVSAAVAIRTLELFEERRILDHVRAITPKFQARLTALKTHPLVGEAAGRGLIGAIEMVADKKTRRNFDPKHGLAFHLANCAQERGLILRPLAGDRVATCPPLIIDEDQIDALFDIFRRALDDTLDHVVRQGLIDV